VLGDLELAGLVQTIGAPSAMLVWLWWSLSTGRLVTRREHQEVQKEVAFWRRLALRSLTAAETIVGSAATGGPPAKRGRGVDRA
jgi:hypothetical protein